MNRSFRNNHIQSLLLIACGTTFAATISALFTAWCYGLEYQYGWDIVGVLLGTLAVVASLVIVACLCSCVSPWPVVLLLAVPLGTLHGFVWARLVENALLSILANFAIPLGPVWIIGSICGLVATALVQLLLPQRLNLNRLTTVSLSALLIAFFGPGLLLASCMWGLLLDDGVVEKMSQSPDQRVIALVINDDCGATCSCSLRVDLKTETRYVREVYRSAACEAWITWQRPTQFRIEDDNGGKQYINIATFGLAP